MLEEFGFTAEKIAARARALLERVTLSLASDKGRQRCPSDARTPPRSASRPSGQSVWIDFLSRESIRGGHLQELIDEDAVVGATSNPSIFEKAMTAGDAYDEQMREWSPADDVERDVLGAGRAGHP